MEEIIIKLSRKHAVSLIQAIVDRSLPTTCYAMANPDNTPEFPPSKNQIMKSSRFPDLMTEEELIEYLRIPEISNAKNPHNVVENLKRMHDLPRLPLCNKVLYPKKAVLEWVEQNTRSERG